MVDSKLIQDVLGQCIALGADFAELFVESKYATQLSLTNGEVDKSVSGRIFGVGIRAMAGTHFTYAFTNDISNDSLLKTAKETATALKENPNSNRIMNLEKQEPKARHFYSQIPKQIPLSDKVDVVKKAYHAAREYDTQVKSATVGYLDWDQEVLIANSEGLLTQDRRIRTRLMVDSIAGEDNMTGASRPGASAGFEYWETHDPATYGKEASRIATTMAKAGYAPAEKMPVIISNAFGGVIFHEACGHQLEATSVGRKLSIFTDKLNEKIASEHVTAYDNGTMSGEWGSDTIDDEGAPMQNNLLIEKGILKGYMIDRLGSRRMDMPSTGSGRRQSYQYAPTSRMTNTYIAPGPYLPEEIIAATDYGLYAKSMGGGSVNPSTGEFNFSVLEAYMIEKGRITKPVRGAILIGKGGEILHKMDMVGCDLALGQGMCGSMSGMIPSNVGQPTLRVSEILVGGR